MLLRPHPRWTPSRTHRKLPEEPARAPSEHHTPFQPAGPLEGCLSPRFSLTDVLRPGPGLLSLERSEKDPCPGGGSSRWQGLEGAQASGLPRAHRPAPLPALCHGAHMPPRTPRPAAPNTIKPPGNRCEPLPGKLHSEWSSGPHLCACVCVCVCTCTCTCVCARVCMRMYVYTRVGGPGAISP